MKQPGKRNIPALIALILAGEAIFFLPFVLARVFRPTFLEIFNINNFELGIMFSVYGIVAMISYFFGGPLADRFASRKLMTTALTLTGLGGLIMASYPDLTTMKYLYGFWGMTTILLFWAAMIRATRFWGGESFQGRAFGFLDGGRGIAAAGIGTLSVYIFSMFLDTEADLATTQEKTEAFRGVIYFVSAFTVCTGILIWFSVKNNTHIQEESSNFKSDKLLSTIRMPVVWLQAIIILCAYVGYKTTDDFSLLANDVLLFDDVDSAKVGTIALWTRVIIAILAGFLADKVSASRIIIGGFLLMLIGSIIIGFSHILISEIETQVSLSVVIMFILSLIVTGVGVFAIRALYFALLEEGNIPLSLTGTVTGIISVIGFTPDIFMGPAMGLLLDNSPGLTGHRHVFLMLAAFSVTGLIASIGFHRLKANGNHDLPTASSASSSAASGGTST